MLCAWQSVIYKVVQCASFIAITVNPPLMAHSNSARPRKRDCRLAPAHSENSGLPLSCKTPGAVHTRSPAESSEELVATMESSLELSNSLGSVSSLLTRCRTFKVLVIGDSGVGKTCLTHRLCAGQFPDRVEATIGVDFRERLLDIDGEKVKVTNYVFVVSPFSEWMKTETVKGRSVRCLEETSSFKVFYFEKFRLTADDLIIRDSLHWWIARHQEARCPDKTKQRSPEWLNHVLSHLPY